MALRVKCKCGRQLKISSKLAGKKIACPACKHPFKISASRFEAAEQKARAGSPAPAAPVAPPPPDPQPASLDDQLLKEASGAFDFSQSDILGDLEALSGSGAPVAIPVGQTDADPVGYARDTPDPTTSSRSVMDAVQGPVRGFWADALQSFVYPVRNMDSAITLLVVFFVAAVQTILPVSFIGLLLTVFLLITHTAILGWFASVYFGVIQMTAMGSDDMPRLGVDESYWEDLLLPAFKYMGAYAVVLAPSIALVLALAMGWVPPSFGVMLPVWIFGGIFLLPISLLLFAFDATGSIFRLDLIFSTIFRTFLPYLAIWLVLVVVAIALLIVSIVQGGLLAELMAPAGQATDALAELGGSYVINILFSLVRTYFMLVAMRVIGLYYLHFKKRFTLVME